MQPTYDKNIWQKLNKSDDESKILNYPETNQRQAIFNLLSGFYVAMLYVEIVIDAKLDIALIV